jgi:glycosyltransferase involved in cell wall biosynthesis
MTLIAQKFEEIIILCVNQKSGQPRALPKNVRVIELLPLSFMKRIFFLTGSLFFLPLWLEFFSSKKQYKLQPNWLLFKIIVGDFVRSSQIVLSLNRQLKIDPGKHILYSYWLDYKALALARIRKKTGCQAVSRCHRWDVYFYANTPQFLPYRQYLIRELSQIFSISEDGIRYMEQLHKYIKPGKITLSKLGKINTEKANLIPQSKGTLTICSCSTLTPVKRVDLIIDFIQCLSKHKSIRWVHYGDGKLRKQIEKKASELLQNVDYQFKGIQPNSEVLKFYKDNYVDLFINLSASEGIPVSIMEAQSAGIPVMATAVGGTPEIVNDENGFLVEQDFNLAEALDQITTFFNASPKEIQAKREAAYANWFNNYNAEKNYPDFAEKLLAL